MPWRPQRAKPLDYSLADIEHLLVHPPMHKCAEEVTATDADLKEARAEGGEEKKDEEAAAVLEVIQLSSENTFTLKDRLSSCLGDLDRLIGVEVGNVHFS